MREWRNRQTRTFEGRVVSPYRFKSGPSHQIRTSRLIETLRFFSFISVSKKPLASAVFGIHRVKVLPSNNVFSLSAAHFLCRIYLKLSVSIKKWNRKFWPRPFVSIVYPFVSTVGLFVSKVWFYSACQHLFFLTDLLILYIPFSCEITLARNSFITISYLVSPVTAF